MGTENTYVRWLETTADELEAQADEDEALANGSWVSGGAAGIYYDRLERVEHKRARAGGYRQQAQQLRQQSA